MAFEIKSSWISSGLDIAGVEILDSLMQGGDDKSRFANQITPTELRVVYAALKTVDAEVQSTSDPVGLAHKRKELAMLVPRYAYFLKKGGGKSRELEAVVTSIVTQIKSVAKENDNPKFKTQLHNLTLVVESIVAFQKTHYTKAE